MKNKWTIPTFKQFLALAMLLLVMMLMQANEALAHASLVKAEPARRAVLSTAPSQVRLWFNEEIEPAYASLSVLDEEKKPVTDNKVKVHPEDAKSIVLELPGMQPGRYTVKFRVLSVDGHVVDSDYNFTVTDKVKKDD